MLVTLRQLQYIVAVAEHKSFSKGAEACFAEQSTVSHQVKLVEDRLGTHIFRKKSQPIEVTPDGEEIVRHAKEILQKVEDLVKPFKAPSGKKIPDMEFLG